MSFMNLKLWLLKIERKIKTWSKLILEHLLARSLLMKSQPSWSLGIAIAGGKGDGRVIAKIHALIFKFCIWNACCSSSSSPSPPPFSSSSSSWSSVSLHKVALHAYWTRHPVLLLCQQFPWWAIKPSHYLLNAREFNPETWIVQICNEMWKLPLCSPGWTLPIVGEV